MASSADSILASAIQYPLEPVTLAFASEHSLPLAISRTLELECKRWLWVTWLLSEEKKNEEKVCDLPPRLVISKELEWIDKYWHHFFQHHPEVYRDFCLNLFQSEIIHTEESLADVRPLTREDLKLQLEYLYDRIGAAGVRRWYVELPALA